MPNETSLVLSVKSTSVTKATKELKGFETAAKGADKGASNLAGTTGKTDKATKGLGSQTDKTRKATDKATNSQKKYDRSLKSTGKSTAALKIGLTSLVVAAGALAKMSVSNAAEIETLEVSFVSLTGSVSKAKETVAELTNFTASTPFQLDGVAAAGRQLITARGSTEGLTADLQKLGDISATVGVPIEELAAIYTKAFNKNKLQAEELNQISERGIPIIRLLAEEYGVTTAEIFKMSSQGQLSFQDLETAFTKMSGEGGLAFGAMNRQSETLNGKLSTLKDNLKLATAELGLFVAETINLKKGISNFSELLAMVKDHVQEGKKQTENIEAQKESRSSLISLLEKEVSLTKTLAKLGEVQLSTTGAAQTIAANAWILTRDRLALVKEELAKLDEEEVTLGRLKAEFRHINIQLRKNYNLTEDENNSLRERSSILGGLIASYNAVTGAAAKASAEAIGGPLDQIPDAGSDVVPVDVKKPKATTTARRATGGGGGGSTRASDFDNLVKSLREEERAIEESYLKRLELIRKNTAAGSELRLELEDKLNEEHQRESEGIAERAAYEIGESANKYATEIQQLIEFYERRKQIILDSTILTEEEKNSELMRLDNERANIQSQAETERWKKSVQSTQTFLSDIASIQAVFGKKGAKIAKAAAIANATIDMARNAILGYQRGLEIPIIGPAMAPIFAGAAIAAGAAQIATIKAQKVGNYATGGILGGPSSTGDAVTFNGNRGEVVTNFEQQRRLLNIANGAAVAGQGNGSSGNVTIINQTSTPVEAETRVNASGDREITIREAVNRTKAEIANEANAGGGVVVPALQRNFGLRRTGT